MSLLSESGRKKLQAFEDWVNADSFDIPPEIVYPEKVDDHHGHGGHDDHGHDEHHDEHHEGHSEEHHEEHHEGQHAEHPEEQHEEQAAEHPEEQHEEQPADHPEERHEEQLAEHPEEQHEEDHAEHDDHGHHGTPSLPQPSREEVRREQVAEINRREEEKRAIRAEKMAALEAKRAAKPKEMPVVRFYHIAAIVAGLLVAAILIITVAFLPPNGSADAPAVNEVSERYLASGPSETGALNAVAGVILDYRAFDTLGESVVLFTATITVLFLLYQFKRKKPGDPGEEYSEYHEGIRSLPARVCFRLSIPFVLLYGIYVVVNGHLSPGGGFSGGTILGAAFVLGHMVFGEKYTSRFITVSRCMKIMAVGLFVYIALKTYHVLTGANGLASGIPLGTQGSILSGGLIFPLNICVGLVVSCTIYALYHLFASWKD